MSEDLKKIREYLANQITVAKISLAYSKDKPKNEITERQIAQENLSYTEMILSLFDAHVAALSQQEAELVAEFVPGRFNRFPTCEWAKEYTPKAGDKFYLHPPKPAPLPQPVASVPQDVEKFANDVAEWSQTQFEDVIRVSHFREFMRQRDAGHARVPVEVVDILRNSPELNTSNYDHDQVCRLNAAVNEAYSLIAASQQEGV